MQELLTGFVNDRPLETHAETGTEQAFRYAGSRIDSVEHRHGLFKGADGW